MKGSNWVIIIIVIVIIVIGYFVFAGDKTATPTEDTTTETTGDVQGAQATLDATGAPVDTTVAGDAAVAAPAEGAAPTTGSTN